MLKNREGAEQANPPVIMEAGGEIQEGGWLVIQQMKLEIEEKTKQLEDQKKNGEQAGSDFSEEIQVLKSENKDLKGEISLMKKKSKEESKEMLERRSAERTGLVSTIALLRKEAEESVNELKLLKDEN
ncbi:hypothetical protein PIB30_089265 [Stylosanthes scabra]|uniref:Uncharacterized protein n=1 Tax=Stylosanthes scabra TaxID=79078 RepID=A0ABU6VTL4_9FABA|nr:hypothetical protein [Stylosanthes scabra]